MNRPIQVVAGIGEVEVAVGQPQIRVELAIRARETGLQVAIRVAKAAVVGQVIRCVWERPLLCKTRPLHCRLLLHPPLQDWSY